MVFQNTLKSKISQIKKGKVIGERTMQGGSQAESRLEVYLGLLPSQSKPTPLQHIEQPLTALGINAFLFVDV